MAATDIESSQQESESRAAADDTDNDQYSTVHSRGDENDTLTMTNRVLCASRAYLPSRLPLRVALAGTPPPHAAVYHCTSGEKRTCV